MRLLRSVLLLGMIALPVAFAHSQVSVGIGVGGPAVVYGPDDYAGYGYGPPICDWGYYPYAPYGCAPYGYYGPSWFLSGIFIGAGPWYGHYGGYGDGFYRRSYYSHGNYGGGYYRHNDHDRDDGYGRRGSYGHGGYNHGGAGYGDRPGYGRGDDQRSRYTQSPGSNRMPYVGSRGPVSGFTGRQGNGGGYVPRGPYGSGNVAPRGNYGGGHAFDGGGHQGGGFGGGGGGHSSGGFNGGGRGSGGGHR